uniref:Peptidase S1 domain-containing protein n=1 Tax=Cyprinus carpio TaxID=7962 RepID=A0A8C2PPE2_CYPCA
MTIISLLLLASLLPHLTFTAHVNVGIVKGQEAKPHSRPYMVSLQRNKTHIYGGFLISKTLFLNKTCLFNSFPALTVVLGAHELQKKSENLVRIKVESYHQHPDYDVESLNNDLLLLKVTNCSYFS